MAVSVRAAYHNSISGNLEGPIASAFWVTDIDNSNKLMPVGSVGELLIQGPVLFDGYAGDQEKTYSCSHRATNMDDGADACLETLRETVSNGRSCKTTR